MDKPETPEEKAKRIGGTLIPYKPKPQAEHGTMVCGKCGFSFKPGQAVAISCPGDCPAGFGSYYGADVLT